MKKATHNFTFVLNVPEFSDELMDAFGEAGCTDAGLSQVGSAVFLEFDREAESYADAVVSALHDVQRKADVQVIRVVSDDVVNASQIADRLSRSRESIRLLVNGERGPGGFPAPIHMVGNSPLWGWGDVLGWFERNEIETPETEAANSFVSALNSSLAVMRAEENLSESKVEMLSELFSDSRILNKKRRPR